MPWPPWAMVIKWWQWTMVIVWKWRPWWWPWWRLLVFVVFSFCFFLLMVCVVFRLFVAGSKDSGDGLLDSLKQHRPSRGNWFQLELGNRQGQSIINQTAYFFFCCFPGFLFFLQTRPSDQWQRGTARPASKSEKPGEIAGKCKQYFSVTTVKMHISKLHVNRRFGRRWLWLLWWRRETGGFHTRARCDVQDKNTAVVDIDIPRRLAEFTILCMYVCNLM